MSTLERKPETEASLSEDLKRVFQVGDSTIAHQFQVSERLDAKARAQVTLAGAWYAVTQAVASVAYASKPGYAWLVVLLCATVAGGVALVATFFFSFRVWRPREESELTHSGFRRLADGARANDPTLTDELVTFYQHVIGRRRESNKARVHELERAQIAWWIAVGLTSAELFIAFLTRLLG